MEHFDAAMVHVSACLIVVMGAETALMAVMRPDVVVSYQTIYGGVGMETLVVRYESCDVRGNQGRFHATLKKATRKECKAMWT